MSGRGSDPKHASQCTQPMPPVKERVPVRWVATATAPLSESTLSGVRERLTEPVSLDPGRPVLPFQAAPSKAVVEVRARQAVVPEEKVVVRLAAAVAAKPAAAVMVKPAAAVVVKPAAAMRVNPAAVMAVMAKPAAAVAVVKKRRNWPFLAASASVVLMLLVTALQVGVELWARSAVAPLPTVATVPTVAPVLPSLPIPEVASVAPVLPAPPLPVAPPVASSARVLPRAPVSVPVSVPRSKRRGDVVDPWAD